MNGAFYEKPKWRKRRYRTPVSVTVEKVIKAKQAASMSDDELNSTIVNAIRNDAGNHLLCKYPQKDKAEGLHNILYRCFSCDSLYTTTSKGNTITCSKCGKTFTLNEDYRFTEAPYTIAAWYDHMTEVELKDIDNVELSAEVSTVIYSNKGKKRKDRGSLRLTHDEVSYRSPNVSFTHKMEKLQAIVFTSGEHVELYYKDEMYYFFPDEDPIQCARWAHIVDIIKSEEEKRIKDGK